MALDYPSYVATLANLMAADPTTPEFLQILPQAISYAENRIYRELDMLNTVVVNSTQALTYGNRNFTLPPVGTGTYITVVGLNVISPGGSSPNVGTRNPLAAVTMDYLNNVWGSATYLGLPKNFAMITQDSIVVGPWPDSNYVIEVIGTIVPEPMSETNPTTLLTVYIPDVFVAASMVFMSGYMRDFGSQADNPQQAQSWENQYQTLFKSAMTVELRKKWAGPGWTSLSAVPVTPMR